MSSRRFAMVATIASVAIACSGGSRTGPTLSDSASTETAAGSPHSGTFTLARARCGYEGSATVEAGEASFTLASTRGSADFDLWLLRDGHGYDELKAHIDEERRRADEGKAPLGHPNFATLIAEASTDDQGRGVIDARLSPGTYGMACIRFGAVAIEGIWAAGPVVVTS